MATARVGPPIAELSVGKPCCLIPGIVALRWLAQAYGGRISRARLVVLGLHGLDLWIWSQLAGFSEPQRGTLKDESE
jgi:hypothetical protein